MKSTKPRLIFNLAVFMGPPLGGLLVFLGNQLLPLGPTGLMVVANPHFLIIVLVLATYILELAPAVAAGLILARLPQRWLTPPGRGSCGPVCDPHSAGPDARYRGGSPSV